MSLMAFSVTSKHWFLATVLVYIFVLLWESGKAYEDLTGKADEDHPHLGAAGVIANEYVPGAEDEGGEGEGEVEGGGEGEGEGEGEGDHHFPEGGTINSNPANIVDKALECFHDKYIYSHCDEAYRLSQSGEINVPPEYTEQYCKGPCLKETHHVLDCIDGIMKHFVFYNKATLSAIRETIKIGCSYGPKRGNTLYDIVFFCTLWIVVISYFL
ncbi:Hypothetical predicted protein [Olea europaea subsp. europaea]|uniref:DUF7731 domain-containing protein n=1 Tax=Olea europaea subsp. europaea TaxID=158383 RepID=A0A8S0RVK2_OLEEU|nr:Hypothetical predicted protein [Olea europaea subsp. europaea]